MEAVEENLLREKIIINAILSTFPREWGKCRSNANITELGSCLKGVSLLHYKLLITSPGIGKKQV